jgi:acyl-CoA dehydrogenase
VLKRFEDEQRPPADLPYAHWALQDALLKAQQGLVGVLDNFPNRLVAGLMRVLIFPFGLPQQAPSDALGGAVAQAMQTPGPDRERLLADCYVGNDTSDPIACAEMALTLLPVVEAIEKRLKDQVHNGAVARMPQNLPDMQQWLADAVAAGALGSEERATLAEFARLTDALVQVDAFAPDYAGKAATATKIILP